MVSIDCKDDCNNAPRKALLRDLNISFARGDVEEILSRLSEDILWRMVGDREIQGKPRVREVLTAMADQQARELHIHHIITHGAQAALDGVMLFQDGSRVSFCDVYIFTGHSKTAKIKEIISYNSKIGG